MQPIKFSFRWKMFTTKLKSSNFLGLLQQSSSKKNMFQRHFLRPKKSGRGGQMDQEADNVLTHCVNCQSPRFESRSGHAGDND